MLYIVYSVIAIGSLVLGTLLAFMFGWRLWGDPD
jgi:hypothetical protein